MRRQSSILGRLSRRIRGIIAGAVEDGGGKGEEASQAQDGVWRGHLGLFTCAFQSERNFKKILEYEKSGKSRPFP